MLDRLWGSSGVQYY